MILIDQKQTRLLHETMEQFLVNVLSRTLLHYLSLVTHQLQSWLSFGAKTIYYRQRLKKGESRQNFSKNRRCDNLAYAPVRHESDRWLDSMVRVAQGFAIAQLGLSI